MEAEFKKAVEFINGLPKDGPYKPSNDDRLKFYGYYKLATEGPNKTPKPGMLDIVGKKKWEAWTSSSNLTKEEAQAKYVELFKKVQAEASK